MISYSKILVGVDLSYADRLISEELNEHGEYAVARAIQLAKGSGGEVTFMTVLEISEQAVHLMKVNESPDIERVEAEANRVLQSLVERAEQAGVKASFVIQMGTGWELLIQEILKNQHTLLVIGGKPAGTLDNIFVGRTTTKLLRKSPVPVLVARRPAESEVSSILIADDFSANAERVVDAGVRYARDTESRVFAVHVLEPNSDAKLVASGFLSDEVRHLQTTRKEQALALLNQRISQTDYRTLLHGVQTRVEYGVPERVIAEKLVEYDIDLLLMGTIGRSGLSAVLLGNTAERLLNKAKCSLLVIKPEKFTSPVKAH